jgi:hypothetical protein
MKRAPDWGVVDALLRELGSLRRATEKLDGKTRDAVRHAVDDAVDAVGASVDDPESDARLTAACKAIVAAREEIESVARTRPSIDPDPRATNLRRKSVRPLVQRRRGGEDRR